MVKAVDIYNLSCRVIEEKSLLRVECSRFISILESYMEYMNEGLEILNIDPQNTEMTGFRSILHYRIDNIQECLSKFKEKYRKVAEVLTENRECSIKKDWVYLSTDDDCSNIEDGDNADNWDIDDINDEIDRAGEVFWEMNTPKVFEASYPF